MTFTRYPRILHRNKKESNSSFLFNFIFFLIGFLLTIIALNIYKPTLLPNELRIVSLNTKQNILVLGLDEVFPNLKEVNQEALWKGRSDTILILSCNPLKNTLNILNIPRDTKIKIPSHGYEKINYLNPVGGPYYTKKYIEKFLRIKIDHFVIINLHGLNKIIDEIGGIVIDVPQRMHYNDRAGRLYINLFPGKQTLNGEQTIGFLRFRHDNLGDIGRIQRQQAFIRSLSEKMLDPVIFTKLPQLISIYKKTILTDLTPRDIIKIANFVRNVPSRNQNIVILPGEFGSRKNISYWIPNYKEINAVINKLFYDKRSFFKFNRINPNQIRISVFNASHKDRFLASKISKILQQYGYTVCLIQDYESHVSKTKIYAQKANSETALQVKYDIGNFGEIIIGNLGPPDAGITILAGDDLVKSVGKVHK